MVRLLRSITISLPNRGVLLHLSTEMTSRHKKKAAQVEKIQLRRGSELATNLLGAFGQSLKETRLTAWLGYLMSMHPEPLMPLFGFSGSVMAIHLETRHKDGRSDIRVETTHGIGVIEAKVGATHAAAQLSRYPARWHALLSSASSNTGPSGIHNVNWQQLADRLDKTIAHSSPAYRFLVTQFNAHLKEHHMIKATESLEIYARDLNEPITLAMFIKARIYGCNYEKTNKVQRAQYFAPYFGDKLAEQQPGISAGISYVARVEQVFVSKNWKEFKDGVCEYRGKQWWNSHEKFMKDLHSAPEWEWKTEWHRSFLLLGEPRLAFNPPIRKEKLNCQGFLGRRFFSFDDLFAAWGS